MARKTDSIPERSTDILKIVSLCVTMAVGAASLAVFAINYGIAQGATEKELTNARESRARIETSVKENEKKQEENRKRIEENSQNIEGMKKDIEYIREGIDELRSKKK